MGYIQKHLLKDERILKRGKVSSSAYIIPVLILILGILTAVFLVGFVLVFYSIAFIARLSSIEVAVTNKRIIGKMGVFSTRSLDLRLAKLEGVSIRRGLIGTMFNFGSVAIAGSGNTRINFPGMHNPEGLRKAFVDAADRAQQTGPAKTPSPSSFVEPVPLFEVQVIDQSSGLEEWIQIKAINKEDAIQRAADTGMIAGQCRLIKIS